MHKNDEIEDFNVWEPKDPKKPYLIRKKDGETLHDYNAAKKEGYLQEWRENQCEQVSEQEFNSRTEGGGDFSGLVLSGGSRMYGNYNFAIFKDGGSFSESSTALGMDYKQYSFQHARFYGKFTFVRHSSFDGFSPFLYAKIHKDACFTISSNTEVSFKERVSGDLLKEPFQGLEIEEGGGFNFLSCHFPEGFTLRNLNLKNSFFWGSNIEKIRFINCDFAEEKGGFCVPARLTLADEYPEKIHKFWKDRKMTPNNELAAMYQLMKKSFEEQKDYQTAGKFYVSEMVFRQKEATGIRKFFLFLYGFLAGYGESIWRTGVLLVLFILFSIFLYRFSTDSWQLAANQTFSSLLLFKNTDDIIFADILSRLLFIPAIFLFLNAIRRRLRRS